jgi:hypothetical protein
VTSVRERFAALDPRQRAALMRALDGDEGEGWDGAWAEWSHGGQVAPAGDWRTWVLMAGRGFGKTRAGAEWVLDGVRSFDELRMSGGRAGPPNHPLRGRSPSPSDLGEEWRLA